MRQRTTSQDITKLLRNTPADTRRTDQFDPAEHLADRAKRAEEGYVHNPALPGLRTIELNISELCNRVCSFCPRSDPTVYSNQKLFMSTLTGLELGNQLAECGFEVGSKLSRVEC